MRSLLARPYAVSAIWIVWAGAVVATVAIGMSAGAYDRSKEGVVGAPLFPSSPVSRRFWRSAGVRHAHESVTRLPHSLLGAIVQVSDTVAEV